PCMREGLAGGPVASARAAGRASSAARIAVRAFDVARILTDPRAAIEVAPPPGTCPGAAEPRIVAAGSPAGAASRDYVTVTATVRLTDGTSGLKLVPGMPGMSPASPAG